MPKGMGYGSVKYNDGAPFMKGGKPYKAKDANVVMSRLPGDGNPRRGKVKGSRKAAKGMSYG